jgi:endo-1,4-beta-xylanase
LQEFNKEHGAALKTFYYCNASSNLLVALLATPFFLILLNGYVNAQTTNNNGKGKFLGNIIGNKVPHGFNTYWDQVTPENAGKWGNVAISPDTNSWNWGMLDTIYNYALSHNILFKYHNFVWGNQQPDWINSLNSVQQRKIVEAWIRMCSERYPKSDLIDVVNEPIQHPPAYAKALGGKGVTGWDWVIWSYKKARSYFPKAKLVINEYNMLNHKKNSLEFLQIIKLLKERKLLDAIGLQAHFLEHTSIDTIKSNLKLLESAGLPIYISEYDVNIANDSTQLAVYKKQFPIFWNDHQIKGATLWGYIQGTVWREDSYLLRTDGTKRPAFNWLLNYVGKTAELHDK